MLPMYWSGGQKRLCLLFQFYWKNQSFSLSIQFVEYWIDTQHKSAIDTSVSILKFLLGSFEVL